MLNASEDSVEAVMEGYESPQKLFANLDSQKPTSDANENLANKNAQKDIKRDIHPRDMKAAILPRWVYSTAIIETIFNDGSYKKGLGTLLENGLYITSAEVIYNGEVVPKHIYAKMQDDLSDNIMCVAHLNVKALDVDSGLALLKVSQFADSYCQSRPQSYYQDRIYKRFGVNVFAAKAAIPQKTQAYYPYLNSAYTFVPQMIKLDEFATYYDFSKQKERVYGFLIGRDAYEEFTYGRAFYDKNGIFLGIMSRVGVGYTPVFINRNVIQDFLCDIQDREIIDDVSVRRACRGLGTKRQRFFNNQTLARF